MRYGFLEARIFAPLFPNSEIPKLVAECPRNRLLTAQIIEGIQSAGFKTTILENEKLDFGSSIQLHFLASALSEIEIVNLGISLAGILEHFRLGEIICEVADKLKQQIAFIASGELSHRLAKNSPHGFFRVLPRGRSN